MSQRKHFDEKVFSTAEMNKSLDSTEQALSSVNPPLKSTKIDRLSLGLSAGVFFGGILGLVLIALIDGPLNQTIATLVCMAIGTLIGAIVSPLLPSANFSN